MKFPLLIAFWKVEITGDPAQAYKYCASSNLDLFLCTIKFIVCSRFFIVGVKGTSYKPSVLLRLPCNTNFLFLKIYKSFLEKNSNTIIIT